MCIKSHDPISVKKLRNILCDLNVSINYGAFKIYRIYENVLMDICFHYISVHWDLQNSSCYMTMNVYLFY